MEATRSSSGSFKRGEGYFALRNIQDSSSGLTVISHPKASVSTKASSSLDFYSEADFYSYSFL